MPENAGKSRLTHWVVSATVLVGLQSALIYFLRALLGNYATDLWLGTGLGLFLGALALGWESGRKSPGNRPPLLQPAPTALWLILQLPWLLNTPDQRPVTVQAGNALLKNLFFLPIWAVFSGTLTGLGLWLGGRLGSRQ